MEEFRIGHCKSVNGRKHFLIIILIDDTIDEEFNLPEELKTYIRTRTYIDATTGRNLLGG